MSGEATTATPNFDGINTLVNNLNNASSDISTYVQPAAVALCVAVAVVMLGRGIIKKFFKI